MPTMYGTDLMQRRTHARVMVHHPNIPRTRAREILASIPLELLVSIFLQVLLASLFC